MIYLHTGLPGAGKTLSTLVEVKARAEKENRPVYYFNINDLKLPWIQLQDGTEWNTVPDGSIIVVDEAQSSFRPRHTGSSVPAYIAAFETHRHRGLDVYLITQHPKLIDANIRRLVGTHVHFVRAFGSQAAVRHEWNEVQEDPQSRNDSIKRLVPYNKAAFQFYKSAESHTHKVRIPWRVFFLLGVPISLFLCAWYLVNHFSSRMETKGAKDVPLSTPVSTQAAQLPAGSSNTSPHLSASQWLSDRAPRVVGLAYSAPVYDEVTKPVIAPYPAACASMGQKCRCYSQQGTILEVPPDTCRSIIERGFFVDWDTTKHQEAQRPLGMGAGSAPIKTDVGTSHPGVSVLSSPTTFSDDLMRINRGGDQPRSQAATQAPGNRSRSANPQ